MIKCKLEDENIYDRITQQKNWKSPDLPFLLVEEKKKESKTKLKAQGG